jgi:Tfp pilus assembly protein PilX
MTRRNENGIALVTAILMLGLMSALLIGATALAVSEQKSRYQMKDRTQAFQAAHSGLEKLTNDLGNLFAKTYAPTNAEVQALTTARPEFPGVKFAKPGQADGTGYTISTGTLHNRTLDEGPFAGLSAQVTTYTVTVTAKTATEAESSVSRDVNTVAIPVFQFGIFSDSDLSFFPGPNFDFGGRVHTNGNLFLAKGGSGTPPNDNQLVLADKVTAVKEIVRTNLSNGFAVGPGTPYAYNVRVVVDDGGCTKPTGDPTDDDSCRKLKLNEGSLVGTLGSAANEYWPGISQNDYGYHIRNGTTGAKQLNLPLATDDAEPIDLIRRPKPGEKDAKLAVYRQRYYQYASLRILLSDEKEDITVLPDKTAGDPQDLSTYAGIAKAGAVPLVKGFIKIDKQSKDGTSWSDVTTEILNLGFTGRGYDCTAGAEASPNAIIRLQRPKAGAGCTDATDTNQWPMQIFDPREGRIRDSAIMSTDPTPVPLMPAGGIMGLVEIDVRNLRLWLKAQGVNIMQETGYVVYFSDRRGIKDAPVDGEEKGELLFEDVINLGSDDGSIINTLDVAEDVNGNTVLDTDGKTVGAVSYYTTQYKEAPARSTPVTLFRRALRLVDGNRDAMTAGGTMTLGLTVASENPVYIQGDYNAITTENVAAAAPDVWNETYDKAHVACAVIADAVTLLSNSWFDRYSFSSPYAKGGPARRAVDATTYRTAIVAGKTLSFPKPSWGAQDFGTDGGTHNFLRYIENWSGTNLWYRGSMVSFYTSRQAVGTFKCCGIVYDAPNRLYTYDQDFKFPDKLPPRTPMIRDINVTSFTKVPPPTQ